MSLIKRVIKDTIKYGEHVCDRCGGTGVYLITSDKPSPYYGGKCLKCDGTGVVVGTYHEYEYEYVEEDDIRKGSVYVKEWFCKKEPSLSPYNKYYYDKETDKAYLLIADTKQVWCPKSATISVEDHDKEVEKLNNQHKEQLKIKLEELKKEKELLEKEYTDFIIANTMDCKNLSTEEAQKVVSDVFHNAKDIRYKILDIDREIYNLTNLISCIM